ncbi:Topless-related protein 1 [Platanthera guangdongensis]|uniref:Topless-related protein 1 n=1 Tax=Platanthera guangdongensis TaxID=2320717 RepID=A0ABR2LPL7_9ASPA
MGSEPSSTRGEEERSTPSMPFTQRTAQQTSLTSTLISISSLPSPETFSTSDERGAQNPAEFVPVGPLRRVHPCLQQSAIVKLQETPNEIPDGGTPHTVSILMHEKLIDTGKPGDRVEWNESEGSVKRTYSGFRKRSNGVVQFDTTKNRFLAAGDDFMVKFWDMDNTNLLTTTEEDGGLSVISLMEFFFPFSSNFTMSFLKKSIGFLTILQASPCIRFNKLGSLLAVSTSDNCIKILANAEGYQLLRSFESRLYSAARSASEAKPMIYGRGPMPAGMRMVPMVLPDGRLGYVL